MNLQKSKTQEIKETLEFKGDIYKGKVLTLNNEITSITIFHNRSGNCIIKRYIDKLNTIEDVIKQLDELRTICFCLIVQAEKEKDNV